MNYEKENRLLRLHKEGSSSAKAIIDHYLSDEADFLSDSPPHIQEAMQESQPKLLESLSFMETVPDLQSDAAQERLSYLRSRLSNIALFDDIRHSVNEAKNAETCAYLIFSEVFSMLPMGMPDRSGAFQDIIADLRFPAEGRFLSPQDFGRLLSLVKEDADSRDYAVIWVTHHLRLSGSTCDELNELIIYLLENDMPKRKRGPNPSSLIIRNTAIKAVAQYICARFNIPLERNPTSNHPSAALIISEALGKFRQSLTEPVVGRIARSPWQSDLGESIGIIIEKTMSTT